jgi:hypothetical protein
MARLQCYYALQEPATGVRNRAGSIANDAAVADRAVDADGGGIDCGRGEEQALQGATGLLLGLKGAKVRHPLRDSVSHGAEA